MEYESVIVTREFQTNLKEIILKLEQAFMKKDRIREAYYLGKFHGGFQWILDLKLRTVNTGEN